MVPLALGTQTAGSVIRPASYNGVVGFKPGFGQTPRTGVVLLSETLDTIGYFGPTIDDVALTAAVASGRAPDLFGRELGQDRFPKVGICRTHEWDRAEPAMQAAVEQAADILDARDCPLPEIFAKLADAHWTILAYETTRSLAWERLTHPDKISATLWEIFELGLKISDADYTSAMALGDRCRSAMDCLFKDWGVDVLITPAAPGEAPLGHATTGDPILNRNWTLLHTPALSLPLLTGPNGLPMGLQVIGPRGRDAEMLAGAQAIVAAFDR